jgi:IgA Peptidase M64/Secretion system C-terminal sorting domain
MKYILSILFLIASITTKAQLFDVDTLLYNGSIDKRINIVILGDGYTEAQMPSFINDGKTAVDYMFKTSPFQEYKEYFNVFIIKVPSIETGVTHPATATDVTEPAFPKATVNSYFGSTFDYGNIHRLVEPTKIAAIISVLANNFPIYDQVLMVVNTPQYGGSGGKYATYTVNASALEIAMHEIGHSFSGLADEYYVGDIYAREAYNMTKETSSSLLRWKNWLGISNVGIFPHTGTGNAALWYKPHQNCKMQSLGNPYCAVCKERIVERIHGLINPINSYFPANASPIMTNGNTLTFTTDLLKPLPNTLKTTWLLNNTVLATKVDAFNIGSNSLIVGSNKLNFRVVDTTTLSKDEVHKTAHIYNVLWTIDKTASTSTYQLDNEVKVSISPNPTSDVVAIDFSLLKSTVVNISIYNQQGKIVKTVLNRKKNEGRHNEIIDVSHLANDLYFIQIRVDNQVITDKIQIIR